MIELGLDFRIQSSGSFHSATFLGLEGFITWLSEQWGSLLASAPSWPKLSSVNLVLSRQLQGSKAISVLLPLMFLKPPRLRFKISKDFHDSSKLRASFKTRYSHSLGPMFQGSWEVCVIQIPTPAEGDGVQVAPECVTLACGLFWAEDNQGQADSIAFTSPLTV